MRAAGPMRWLPDALTYARVAFTIATYPVAIAHERALFAVLVLLMVVTDVLDGPIARRLGVADARGANMDSIADFFFYVSLPAWVWIFAPEVVRSILPVVVGYTLAYSIANAASRIRRGVIGFHNRFTRAAGTAGVIFALWTVLWGFEPVIYYATLAIGTLDLAQRYVNIYRAKPPSAEEYGGRVV